MSTVKKYGTFEGVFTPSILTILGVIMYLRLPWIVGQAGLWMTIGIILIAHIISITTGLSVASIATDKKVKAGGVYYIISRSLGLPIGGTLGIALFIGMSFSISLYLIGFSESVLPYLGLAKNSYNIRLIGSATLIAVAAITLISTSLAMKTQYLILSAIILSLISIFISQNAGLLPEKPHLSTFSDSAIPFAKLFGVFFPAVTGFTAGVSMSGDLRDPKRSIPIGTIASILVGLLVYLALATFLAFRVDSANLRETQNILQSVVSKDYLPFLLAGIWGATISSSIGSILGAPRVLQATSVDGITPKVFGRGYGKTAEPRNALLLTICIAEAGILIGELDIIARIVSMFYITAYGFLNISCVVESWVSPDFRPEFKIPKWIGLLGTLTSLVVMIQLDLLAMLASTFLMIMLFLYIKRRELSLEAGDTLGSIWSSVVRYGLYNLSKDSIHERNWRPNILLFSGGTDSRPYLVGLSRALAENRGIITNFHLVEKKEIEQISRSQIIEAEVKEFEGVFSRKIECNDIYEEMIQISRYHGFSGMEPNTVFLGRARSLSNAESFARLIRNLESMDYNVLMLDYKKGRGFGNRKHVDIWWSGHGNNLSFALSLVRFLQTSLEWSEAEYRFLVISNDKLKIDSIYMRLEAILNEYRISGSVEVVFNPMDAKPFFTIIQEKSQKADLTLLGLPNYHMEDAKSIGRKIGHFSNNLNSILWLKASSYFHNLSLTPKSSNSNNKVDTSHLPELSFTSNIGLQLPLSNLAESIETYVDQFYEKYIATVYDEQYQLLKKIESTIRENYLQKLGKEDVDSLGGFATLKKIGSYIQSYKTGELQHNVDGLSRAVSDLQKQILQEGKKLPRFLKLVKHKSEITDEREKRFVERQSTWRKLLFNEREQYYFRTSFSATCILILEKYLIVEFDRRMEVLTHNTLLFIQQIYQTISLLSEIDVSKDRKEDRENLEKCIIHLNHFMIRNNQSNQDSKFQMIADVRNSVNEVARVVYRIDNRSFIKKMRKRFSPKEIVLQVDAKISRFAEAIRHLTSIIDYGVLLLIFQEEIKVVLKGILARIHSDVLEKANELEQGTISYLNRLLENGDSFTDTTEENLELDFEVGAYLARLQREFAVSLNRLPSSIQVLNQASLHGIESNHLESMEIHSIPLRKYIEHLLDTLILPDIHQPIENDLSKQVYQLADTISKIRNECLEDAVKDKTKRKTNLKKKINAQLGHLKKEKLAFLANMQYIYENIEISLVKEFPRLNMYYLIRRSESLGFLVRKSGRRQFYQLAWGRLTKFVTNLLVGVVFGKSKAFLWTDLFRKSNRKNNTIRDLPNWVFANTISPTVIDALPFYYRNVFLKKESFDADDFKGMHQERGLAKKALQNPKSGFLFIHGMPNSGKTWLARYIASEFFSKEQSIFLDPENVPHRDVASLYKILSKQCGYRINKVNLKEALQNTKLLFVDDLELFWTRKENGMRVLEEFFQILRELSQQIVILVTLNRFTYEILRKSSPVDNYTIASIECQPFNAKRLLDVILTKHRSTGYGISLQGVENDEISTFAYARLFDKIFLHSGGYIGQAMRSWLVSIEKVDKSSLFLQNRLRTNLEEIMHFDPLWDMILIQIILHKVIDTKDILQHSQGSEKEFTHAIEGMKRMQLIQEIAPNVLQLNPDTQNQIIRSFTENEFL
ncbi:MAG: hypothetical protein AAF518_06480 [Spirochaetota bacterium]